MMVLSLRSLCALAVASACLAGPVHAADTPTTPVENARIDDFAEGQKALAAKDWKRAAASFSKVVAQNPRNADAYNLLGYSNRWLGKYPEAFAAYDKALALDPNHKGALEYAGVAYLKVNQKDKAEAYLARLKAICAQCEETTDLAKAIAAYKPAQ